MEISVLLYFVVSIIVYRRQLPAALLIGKIQNGFQRGNPQVPLEIRIRLVKPKSAILLSLFSKKPTFAADVNEVFSM